MQRILEQEYLDTPAEASEYDHMDNGLVNQSVVDGLLEADVHGWALDLGAGPCDIAILVAREAGAVSHITALDAAESMLHIASEKIASAGLSDRITLQRGDVKDLKFEDGNFDLVYSNSMLHHIPDPLSMLREAWRVLAPGGTLWIRDLCRPADQHGVNELVEKYAEGSPRQRQMFDDSLHAGLTVEEIGSAAAHAGIPSASIEMTSDRHYTLIARKFATGA